MSNPDPAQPKVNKAESNGIPPPSVDLPYPDKPETITANLLKLTEQAPDARTRDVFRSLLTHMHAFVNETSLTTAEWMAAIQFLTRTGQTCTALRQEFILLSDVLGVSALVDALNNPTLDAKSQSEDGQRKLVATESSVLGPFFTEDAPDVDLGASIASEGKGAHMFVAGRVLNTRGESVAGAVLETWETDELGFYDTQYAERGAPDCRGRLRTDAQGNFGYRAVVPVAYPIPGDGPVGELLVRLGRHNMRPNHLHMMVQAPGYTTLTTALYPEGDTYLASDAVFGVKKSLVVKLDTVNDEAEARRRGFPGGGAFKLLEFDLVLSTEEESRVGREMHAKEVGR